MSNFEINGYMSVKVFKQVDIRSWDEELKKLRGSMFLSREWLISLQNDDTTPIFLKFFRNEKLIGMISGFERPVSGGNKKQLFFYSNFALKEHNQELAQKCKEALIKYARDNLFFRITMRSYDSNLLITKKGNGFIRTNHRFEYILDLKKRKEEIIREFDSDMLRIIKKARKNGLSFHYCYSENLLSQLIKLASETLSIRKKKGYGGYEIFVIPFLNPDALRKLLISKAGIIFFTKQNNEILSMQFYYIYNKKAYGLIMGTKRHGYEIGAPSFLFYESALKLHELGFESINFGGIPKGTKHEGVKRFKMKMGATPVESYEETTDLLLFPLKILNVLLIIKRIILGFYIPWIIKKQLKKIFNLFLKDIDHY